ncbi:hypothetical protein X759_12310 [Mesorhizobium sp. LSHC420B00]|nr:hypothetical protein X759_12310 [Mesorhizobium sp. LSHC420B00]
MADVGGEGDAGAVGDELTVAGDRSAGLPDAASSSDSGERLPCVAPLAIAWPFSQARSSTGMSHVCVARSRRILMALRAAEIAAIEDEKAPRLPSVISL